jgi:hypothetical protein
MADETYLDQLCDHLANCTPKLGEWITVLSCWPQHGDPLTHRFFPIDVADLFEFGNQAKLPLPLPHYDDRQHALEENALAAVLCVYARLRGDAFWNPHLPGSRDLGTVVGSIPLSTLSVELGRLLMNQFSASHHQAWSRLLYYLPHATRKIIDLRTVAALAWDVPAGPGQELASNPTGFYADALKGRATWRPVEQFMHSYRRRRPQG